MKASVLYSSQYPTEGMGTTWPIGPGRYEPSAALQATDASLEMACRIDELGFDWISFSEHHYSPRILCPNPILTAAAVSQHIKRARIALLGPVLPLLNPVRVAEELATLDNFAGGRLIAGFLRGIPTEFQTYTVNPNETRELFEEGLELILNAWTQPEPFSWEGRHFRYRTVSVWPRPVQQPLPPLYMSGKSPESGTFAARHHMGMCLSFNNTEESLDAITWYKDQCVEAGWEASADNVLYRGYAYIAETDEQAQREAGAFHFGVHNPTPAGPRARAQFVDGDISAARLRGESDAPHPARATATLERSEVWGGTFFCGSPDTVFEQVKYAREAIGIGVVDLIVGGHGLPFANTMRSLDLFGREVLPRIREL